MEWISICCFKTHTKPVRKKQTHFADSLQAVQNREVVGTTDKRSVPGPKENIILHCTAGATLTWVVRREEREVGGSSMTVTKIYTEM